jgi:hypothetical protein
LPFVEDILKNGHMAVPPWPDAGLGHTYRRAIAGDIKVIRIGRLKRIPTPWLRQRLGLDEPPT